MNSKTWQPTARQETFLQLPDQVFEALYGGQAGGGKSEVLLQLPLARGFHQHPRFKALILRRTSPELEREVISRSEVDGYYQACGGSYNGQQKRWKFPSGAMVQFGHCEHEKSVKIYDTAQYNYVAFDEVTSFTPYQYEYLTYSRCRTSNDNLPAFVRSGTNPGGVSHNYFRSRFIGRDHTDAATREGKIIIETRNIDGKEFKVKIAFIKSTVDDNPHIIHADPTYKERMQRLPEAERIAKAMGDWWIYSGQVFEDFRAEHLPSEPDNALHVIEPFEIPIFWPKILTIDWGYRAMTHALWLAINPLPDKKYPAKIYAYREYAAKKEKISTWAGNLRSLSHGENLTDVVLDPSGFGKRGQDRTIAEQFAEAFGREARKADNDRIGGKLLVQEYLKWRSESRIIPVGQYDNNEAIRIYRLGGASALDQYKRGFLMPEDEGPLPRLKIFNNCSVLINCIPLCIYDNTKNVNDDKPPEDVKEFSGDDPYDNLRYGLKACQFYLESGMYDYNNESRRMAIINSLRESGNQTNFYMNMNRLEHEQTKLNQPFLKRRYGSFHQRMRMRQGR